MNTSNYFKTLAVVFIIAFTFQIAFAQSIEGINENIGGGQRTNSQTDSKNGNTFLYVAAGAIVVGLIVWKVFLDKKDTQAKDEIKTDSTKADLNKTFYNNLSNHDLQLEKIQNQIPFEIFLGLQNDEQAIPRKNLTLGFRFKL